MRQSRLFCFGLGYSATRLAQHLMSEDWQVAGTARDDGSVDELKRLGIDAYPFDRARPLKDPQAALKGVTHLLSSVPPDADGDAVLDLHGGAIDDRKEDLKWIGYLSTTGVYGDRDGGWVKEDDALRPTSTRARRRVEAESRWRALGAHAFRLAGIYGPGRNAIEEVLAGRAKRIDKPGHVFSRIHVDDISNVIAASMLRPAPGAIYNVCDDEAAAAMDVVTYACDLIGMTPPPVQPFAEAKNNMTAMGQTFWADNKRVDNGRIKTDLGVTLRYPDYRQGLKAIFSPRSDKD